MQLRIPFATQKTPLTKTTSHGVFIPEYVQDVPELPMGPFARSRDGAIVCVEETEALRSTDEGRTWERTALFPDGADMKVRPERAILATRDGTIVVAFEDEHQRHFTWDDALKDAPGARMPTYAMRSLDGGRTWQDVQKLHDEWTGAIRDIKQTRDGRIVFTTMKMLNRPGRHSVLTYASDDEGQTWTASNVIDLGGQGHHGGVTESTVIELESGVLLMYLRTNWEQFWRAESHDGGLSWWPMGPTGIDASSAPGLLHRCASGRIALVWNRVYPEGQTDYPRIGGDGLWSAVPVSNHRGELSIAFSEDEGETWSKPVVIARHPEDKWLAYPYVFEAQPGELWITTMQGDLRLKVREADVSGG